MEFGDLNKQLAHSRKVNCEALSRIDRAGGFFAGQAGSESHETISVSSRKYEIISVKSAAVKE